MAQEPDCQLRRRRSSGNPNLPLNLECGYQVTEGGPSQGTPTPSNFKQITNNSELPATSALQEFRKKQQSFDIGFEIQIEECEEEEIVVDSEEEGGEDQLGAAGGSKRAVTPTPIQDFGANVTYSEGKSIKVRSSRRDPRSKHISHILHSRETDGARGSQSMNFLNVKTIEHDSITDVSDADSEGEE